MYSNSNNMTRVTNILKQCLRLNILVNLIKIVCTNCNIQNQQFQPLSYPYGDSKFNASLIRNCDCDTGQTHQICIRKCCDINYVLKNKMCVLSESINFKEILIESIVLQENNYTEINFLSGFSSCSNGRYSLNFSDFFLQKDGKLRESGVAEPFNYDEFCVDYYNERGLTALVCLVKEPATMADILATVGMLVSVPFLLATFIVYAILPQRKLHGNALMCYVISLLGGFTLLAVLRLKKYGFSEISCMAVVVPCIFFFLASFFWMNVMSIDIWWTFSGFGGFRKGSEKRRFLFYSAYAWGAPLLVGILITSLSLSPLVPKDAWYNPGVGRGTSCWFGHALQELIYFYGPLSFLTIANVALFAVTAFKIRQAQKDTAVLRKSDSQKHGDDDAQRFSLYLKLLLVMGLNWSMEIISYAVDWQVGEVPPAVWYITDFCNALYGVFIFFLFCFNKKTLKLLKSRFKCGSTPERPGFSTSTVAETRPLKAS